jgi:hypothetical protein
MCLTYIIWTFRIKLGGRNYIHCMAVVVFHTSQPFIKCASKMLKILIWTEQEDMCLVQLFHLWEIILPQDYFSTWIFIISFNQKTSLSTAIWNHDSSFITGTEHCKISAEYKIMKQCIINPLCFHLDFMYPDTVWLCNLKVCYMLSSSVLGMAKGYESAIHAFVQLREYD